MSRTSFLVLVGFAALAPLGECQAQVGFGSRRGFVNTGANVNVAPVLTNQNRYARMSMSVGFSQLVEMQTFTPVQGFPGLMPVNPIGFGLGFGGINPGTMQGFGRWPQGNKQFDGRAIPKPTSGQFVDAAWKFDKDKDARLDQKELEHLVVASVAVLKRDPLIYKKLEHGARAGRKAETAVSQNQVNEAFLKQCLAFDRDKDGKLNPNETDTMAVALARFLK